MEKILALKTFWTIAFRDLIRNRRRTFTTLLAVALGMLVVMLMAGMLRGVMDSAMRDNINVVTGHLQLRAESYEAENMSLLGKDLVQDPQYLVTRIEVLPEVKSVAPVLWASTILSTPRESTGLKITGIDPDDVFHSPIRQGMVEGEYLNADDRGQILLSQRLAEDMEITVGQQVSLATGDANGGLDEGLFNVKGTFNTGFPGYDNSNVIMPLSQAQSFTRTGDRASSIIVILNDSADTAKVAAALATPGIHIYTWEDMNQFFIQSMQAGESFYYLIYIIVILVVAILIANTLLMSVFERTREMGILASLGMKQRQIMVMVLIEAAILALIGIFFGVLLGLGAVGYLAQVGFDMGEGTAGLVEGMAFSSKMYPAMASDQFLILSLLMFGIVVLVSVYPAWYASRMEPVEALHAF
ncbi:MAG: ABC transporter permease [Candidatus Promineifilaceae bacterium]|jgi:ABC-type lipoprotein release transport system permease subunit